MKMKQLKWILTVLLLASLLLTSLAACGGDKDTTPSEADEGSGPVQPAKPTEAAQVEPTSTPVEPTTVPEPQPTEEPTPEPTAVPEAQPTEAPTPEPTAVPEAQPTKEPEPTAEPVEEEELDASSLADISQFSSYRTNMRILITGTQDGEPIEQVIEFTVEYTAEPLAQHIYVKGAGVDEASGLDEMEMYQIEDTMYISIAGEWFSAPAEEGDLSTEGIVAPDDLLGDTCGWKKGKKTEINGVQAQHWSVSKDALEDCMPPEQLADLGDITDAGGDLYVAVDGSYVVQLDIFYEGENVDLDIQTTDEPVDEGRVEIHFAMSDVNVPFTIELPEEAIAGTGMPSDIPAPPDAEEVSSMFGMISLMSPSEPAVVAEFYQTEMPNNGWTEASAEAFGDMHTLEFTKDGRTASIMISFDSDVGKSSVLITVTE
jgi:hypothetical protein